MAVFSTAIAHDTFLADLTADVEAGLGSEPLPVAADALLERVFRAAPPFRFVSSSFVVLTDRRWYSTIAPEVPGAPELVLRRWPGDTVVAFYRLPAGDAAPDLPGAVLGPPVADGDGVRTRDGSVRTTRGKHPVTWVERVWGDGRLAALLVPGDAGLGPGATAALRTELLAVWGRVQPWPDREPPPAPAAASGSLGLPELLAPPLAADEGRDPWQVVRATGFTLGLPPGVRARRADGNVAPPKPVAGGRLWFRGRFVDRDGETVVIGDGGRGAYVARVADPSPGWRQGRETPLGAPRAEPVSGDAFDVAVEWTGCRWARAEYWKEPGFSGRWVVFRLGFSDGAWEIGIPAAAGHRSLALFWIPATLRGEGKAPAPPPIDPARRFGIRFERLSGTDRRRRPLVEGYLVVPGLRMELPRTWYPTAALRSADGFPVRLMDGSGDGVGRLLRFADGTRAPTPTEGGEWEPVGRPRSHGAAAVHRAGDGSWLFLGRDGVVFLLERTQAERKTIDPRVWERMARTVQLTRGAPRKR